MLALFRTAGHSRLPVYGETLDDPRGMVHIRDFLDFLASEPRFGLVDRPRRREAAAEPATPRFGMSMPLSGARASCGRCCSRRPRCRRSICW